MKKVVYKHKPLKFVNASTAKESRKIDERLKRADKKGGWVSTEVLLKKHNIK